MKLDAAYIPYNLTRLDFMHHTINMPFNLTNFGKNIEVIKYNAKKGGQIFIYLEFLGISTTRQVDGFWRVSFKICKFNTVFVPLM